MRITHLGHACLLVELAGTRILLDPGTFSPEAQHQRDLDAVLVTHQHPDHLDVENLPALLEASPGAQLVTDPETSGQLQDKGIDARALRAGDEVTVKSVTVSGVGEMHALIHDDIPRIHNTGMRLTAEGEPVFFHPGDALDADPGRVDVLAFPLSAPWARSRDMTGFLRRLAAPHAIPIHDALLSEVGRTLYLTQAGNLGSPSTQIHDLAGGQSAQFQP
ncbi:MBL fold metallo-hydrolase [Pedococcus sp. KACC 23699]|uniref:MBL fold metallo-hydrolase n=1 Tax=Pedococcus sp. KACC 23699 TaxID=3149228 RepID=A0AAU7JTJ8_9MICO